MGEPAKKLDLDAPIPPQWRELYADMAAEWIRRHGTLPPSLEVLVQWGTETDSGVPVEAEIAYLEGKASDPWLTSSSG